MSAEFIPEESQLIYTKSIKNTNEICGICRRYNTEKCIDCISNNPDLSCIIYKCNSNHTFHYHCIKTWMKKRNTCPLCNIPLS